MAGPRRGVGGEVTGLPARVLGPSWGREGLRAVLGARGSRRVAVGLSRVGCGCLRAARCRALERPTGAVPGMMGDGAVGGRAGILYE